MKSKASILIMLIQLLIIQCLMSTVLAASRGFDFFYFVQQWPGSYCDTGRSCCYPTTGKPAADFVIHGLRPNYLDGSSPSNCNPNSPFRPSQISDLKTSLQRNWPALSCPSSNGTKLWRHEWIEHGTCSEPALNQHDYFEAALNLKKKANLLQILKNAGIEPDDGFYGSESINTAIREATGYEPGVYCNVDSSRNSQLLHVYMCVDTSRTRFIECPGLPGGGSKSGCKSTIQFPKF